MIEFEEYKQKINGLRPTLELLGGALKIDEALAEIAKLEAESAEDGFWNDMARSQKVQKQLKQLKNKCDGYRALQGRLEDLLALCDMALECDDAELLPELTESLQAYFREHAAT